MNAEQFQQVQIRHRSKSQEDTAHRARSTRRGRSPRAWKTLRRTPCSWISPASRGSSAHGKRLHRESWPELLELGMDAHVAVSANVETARIVARALSGVTVVPDGPRRHDSLKLCRCGMLSPSPHLRKSSNAGGDHLHVSRFAPRTSLSERGGKKAFICELWRVERETGLYSSRNVRFALKNGSNWMMPSTIWNRSRFFWAGFFSSCACASPRELLPSPRFR